MKYKVKKYTLDQAKKYGVVVKPSNIDGKKIDVFEDGNGFGWRYFMDVDYFKFGKPYWCPLDI